MKKFKKVLLPILAVLLLLSVCSMTSCGLFKKDSIDLKKEQKSHEAFIDELGGVSDTYVGAVSDTVYDSNEIAARAYIYEQIAGDNNISVTDTISAGELTKDEISALKLSEQDANGLLSVEAVDVTIASNRALSNNRNSGITPLATLDTSRTVKVYIIKYDNGFKYYSPCPITGETVTRSYYDSVFNSEKYKNCTYTTTMTIEEQIALLGFIKINVDIVTTQTIRYADNAIYIEQKTNASKMLDQDSEIYAYVIEDEYGSIDCYVSDDGETWNPGSLSKIGFNSIDELVPFHDQYLDYTYFTKTDYGFELAKENAKQYLDESLSELDTSDMKDLEIDMFAKYYVCEGTLSGMRMEMYMDFAMPTGEGDDSIDVGASAVTEMKITDCGKTVVELPFDVN